MATFLTYKDEPKPLAKPGPFEARILGVVGNVLVWEHPSQTGYATRPLKNGQRAVGFTPLAEIEKVIVSPGEPLPEALRFLASGEA